LVWDYRMPIYVFFIQILRAFEEVFKWWHKLQAGRTRR
jgi:hypothetical protein